MLLVDDEVPRLEGERVHGGLAAGGEPPHLARRGSAAAGDVGGGDEGEPLLVHDEAGGGGGGGHVADGRFERGRQVVGEDGRDVGLLQLFAHPAADSRAFDRDHLPPGGAGSLADAGDGCVDSTHEPLGFARPDGLGAFAGESGEGPPSHAAGVRAGAGVREAGEGRLVDVDGDRASRRRRRPRRGEELLGRGDERVRALGDAFGFDERDPGVRREGVEDGDHVHEGGGEGLHALRGGAGGDPVEHVDGSGQVLDQAAGAGSDAFVDQDFAARRRVDLPDRLERALVGHGEGPDLLDFVAEQLDARRTRVGGREDVEDPAAHGELSAAFDHVHSRVGGTGQVAFERFEVDGVAEAHANRREIAQPGGDGLQEGAHRHGQDPQGREFRGVGEAALDAQAPRDGVGARGEPLVGQGLPCGEDVDGLSGQIGAQGGGELFGAAARRGDGDGERPRLLPAGPGVRGGVALAGLGFGPARSTGPCGGPSSRGSGAGQEREGRGHEAAGHGDVAVSGLRERLGESRVGSDDGKD